MILPRSSPNDFVRTVKYEMVATVHGQCDEKMSALASPANALSAVHKPVSTSGSGNRNSFCPRKMTPEEVCEKKATKSCRKCGQFDHWVSDHALDG